MPVARVLNDFLGPLLGGLLSGFMGRDPFGVFFLDVLATAIVVGDYVPVVVIAFGHFDPLLTDVN